MQQISGKVIAVFINPTDAEDKQSVKQDTIFLDHEGIEGDRHSGYTLFTKGAREREVFGLPSFDLKNGKVEFENWRQWTAVSVEEMKKLAEKLELNENDPVKLASLLGANMLVSDIPNFSKVPPTSMFSFPSGALLKVESINFPCVNPGIEINKLYPQTKAARFPKLAWNLRGLVGRISIKGSISTGDQIMAYIRQIEVY